MNSKAKFQCIDFAIYKDVKHVKDCETIAAISYSVILALIYNPEAAKYLSLKTFIVVCGGVLIMRTCFFAYLMTATY